MKKVSEKFQNTSLALLRITIGWLFLYAGWTKIIDASWSAAGYLNNAQAFPNFFAALTQPGVIDIVNTLNQWGLFLIGFALIFGAFVRISSVLGIVLMFLYYLPVAAFPHVEHGYIVDDHIVYIVVFVVLIAFDAGHYWGLDRFLNRLWTKN
jgi:thiosulfate dehydrogenase [quinone] large subunit